MRKFVPVAALAAGLASFSAMAAPASGPVALPGLKKCLGEVEKGDQAAIDACVDKYVDEIAEAIGRPGTDAGTADTEETAGTPGDTQPDAATEDEGSNEN